MMLIIGEIVASTGIESDKWIALIKSHGALANVPPRKGINPFTHQPCEYKASSSTALVQKGGADIGSIYWAMDGSPMLIVQSQEDSVDTVVSIAEEIASSLGGQFVRQSYAD